MTGFLLLQIDSWKGKNIYRLKEANGLVEIYIYNDKPAFTTSYTRRLYSKYRKLHGYTS
jgi:hypothetical protein